MNSTVRNSRARAVADLAAGEILASVEVAAPPERVFQALASNEIVTWWVGEGIVAFRTTEWTGEVRVGGGWRASGVVDEVKPFALEGEFLEIDPPRKLVHTYGPAGAPGKPTTVTYVLEQIDGGTRITLRHVGFTSRESCIGTYLGWETLFERLAERMARAERGDDSDAAPRR